MGGRIAHEVDIQTLMLKRATVTGSTMRGRTAAEKQQIAEALRRHVWPLLEAGKCKPLISPATRWRRLPRPMPVWTVVSIWGKW